MWEKNQRPLECYHCFGCKVIGQHEFLRGSDGQNGLILRKGFQSNCRSGATVVLLNLPLSYLCALRSPPTVC